MFNFKMLKKVVLLSTLVFTGLNTFAYEGCGSFDEGNGNSGDFVLSNFIERGQSIIKNLTETEKGQALVRKRRLNVNDLKSTLSINVIKVTNEKLFDNNEWAVDSVVNDMSITLNKEAWISIFEEDCADKLVFHVMLMAANVYDNDYVISEEIYYITPVTPVPSDF